LAYPLPVLPKAKLASRLWQALPDSSCGDFGWRGIAESSEKKKGIPPQVAARIRSLFKDWASNPTPLTNSRKMDEKEELWCAQFQIPNPNWGQSPPHPIQALGSSDKEQPTYQLEKRKELLHSLF
jgi:hypothetical protein